MSANALVSDADKIALGQTAIPSWWGDDTRGKMDELMATRALVKQHWQEDGWLTGKDGSKAMGQIEGLLSPAKVDMSTDGSGAKASGATVDEKDKSSRVTDGGQVRNITIKFDSYIKGNMITQNQQVAGMSKDEFDRWLREHFLRLLHDVENAYA